MKSLLLFAISFLVFSPFSSAQMVWPGDVNNNGIVNDVDLLHLVFAFGETGEARTTTTSEWAGQNFTSWSNNFPDGLDFAYADCNGDGVVDELDVTVIKDNLTLTHDDVPFIADEILEANAGNDPKFAFLTENLTVQQGGSYTYDIGLGDDDNQISNLLGISFTIKVNSKFFKVEESDFRFKDLTWIKDLDVTSREDILRDSINGNLTVVLTNTDGQTVGGAGQIGEFSFVIIENIVDFLVASDTLKIEIDNITMITDELEKIPIGGTSIILDLEGRTTSTYDPILDKIQLYPNPTTGWVLLKTNKVEIERVELVNALGQTIYHKKTNKNHFQSLDLQAIPKGLYWLKMISKYGIKSTPIQKL